MADDDFNRRNIEEFRANHGRLGGQFEGAPVLLLHSTGARSGDNLLAHPDVQIEVGDERLDVRAVELHGAERDAKYAIQAERYPGFAEYERKTTRTIPVVALVPRQTPS